MGDSSSMSILSAETNTCSSLRAGEAPHGCPSCSASHGDEDTGKSMENKGRLRVQSRQEYRQFHIWLTQKNPAATCPHSALAKPYSLCISQRNKVERLSPGDLATEKLLFYEF